MLPSASAPSVASGRSTAPSSSVPESFPVVIGILGSVSYAYPVKSALVTHVVLFVLTVNRAHP